MTDTPDAPVFALRDLLGFSIEHGEARGASDLVVDERHMNPNGVVHGTIPYVMIDTAMGAATMSVLAEGLYCATIEIHVRYLRPCLGGTLRAEATVRKAGRRIVHLDAVVTGSDGAEIAVASGTFAVLAP